MKYYTLRIVDIRNETPDCITILFKQPALKPLKYRAGQYLSLIFRINNRRYVRPYSFSSAPGVDKTLNITVKRVPGGIVSNHIIDKLKIDDVVEVIEPMGDFILNDNLLKSGGTNIYLWGAGSGITPLISIAKYALYHNTANVVTLVYGNRYYENIIFREEIANLMEKFAGKFSAQHFLTQPYIDEVNPAAIVQGRITADEVKSIIIKGLASASDSIHYICGPAGLKDSVKLVLSEFCFAEDQIFSEDFEVTRNPKDFENIRTRYVSITRNSITTQVEVAAGKSILEAGLDALLELSYSCQTGNCLICKGQIINGEVKMIGVKTLPESLGVDECLLCSSFPLTDDIEIAVE